jgi:prephenate dehydrogenase
LEFSPGKLKVTIVGAGLIGTSLGLALKRLGASISFADLDPSNLRIAQDLVGGAIELEPDLVVVATPVGASFEVLKAQFALHPQAMFIDIGGLKSKLINDVEGFSALAERFCGTHPMAGREIVGAHAARADLFEGRTWIVTPTHVTPDSVTQEISRLLTAMGGFVLSMSPDEHDRAVALVSHLPQIMSSLTSSTLVGAPLTDLEIAGQGLRDTTRLADSSAHVWVDLLLGNRDAILKVLESTRKSLDGLVDALDRNNRDAVTSFIERGNAGRAVIPGKHGGKSRSYTFLPIVIDDKPGELARIFDECAEADVNVEDLVIEHSPGQQTGLITLALNKEDAVALHEHLLQKDWRVHALRESR